MAITEITLVSLALSLSANPTQLDIQSFQLLSEEHQIYVEQLVERKDILPIVLERLKERGIPAGLDPIEKKPTHETTK